MKEINGIKYYSKADITEMLGCSEALINKRIGALGIRGYYIGGHAKYYTPEQITQIVEYLPKKDAGEATTENK